MSKEWKGSIKPSFNVATMEPIVLFWWIMFIMNAFSLLAHIIAGSQGWGLLAIVCGAWFGYRLYEHYTKA